MEKTPKNTETTKWYRPVVPKLFKNYNPFLTSKNYTDSQWDSNCTTSIQ